MTILRGSDSSIESNRGKPTSSELRSDKWVRPLDWLPLPSIVSGEDKIVGLVAVNEYESNWVSVRISGAYTVNWGDGTTSDHSSGSIASKNIAWGDISASTLSSKGYRQALVQITPQAGQQLTSVELGVIPASLTSLSSLTWLDVAVALPNATLFRIGSSTTLSSVRPILLEKFEWIGPSSSLTDVSGLVNGACRLRSINLFDTSNVTTTARMFANCSDLDYVPFYNIGNSTSASIMFYNCTMLKEVPLFDTKNVTAMDTMFYDSGLVEVPLFNTSNVTTMNNFINFSENLKSIPLLDTSKVTNFSSMQSQNPSLTYIPEFNIKSGTSFSNMLANMPGVTRVDLIPARSLGIGAMNLSSSELNRIYTRLPSLIARTITNAVGNGTLVTYTTSVDHNYIPGMVITMSGITPSAYNLASQVITSCPTTTTFTVANTATGTYVSGGTATPASATLTVTGNWGVASDDPTIATAKGWTVTG